MEVGGGGHVPITAGQADCKGGNLSGVSSSSLLQGAFSWNYLTVVLSTVYRTSILFVLVHYKYWQQCVVRKYWHKLCPFGQFSF